MIIRVLRSYGALPLCCCERQHTRKFGMHLLIACRHVPGEYALLKLGRRLLRREVAVTMYQLRGACGGWNTAHTHIAAVTGTDGMQAFCALQNRSDLMGCLPLGLQGDAHL